MSNASLSEAVFELVRMQKENTAKCDELREIARKKKGDHLSAVENILSGIFCIDEDRTHKQLDLIRSNLYTRKCELSSLADIIGKMEDK